MDDGHGKRKATGGSGAGIHRSLSRQRSPGDDNGSNKSPRIGDAAYVLKYGTGGMRASNHGDPKKIPQTVVRDKKGEGSPSLSGAGGSFSYNHDSQKVEQDKGSPEYSASPTKSVIPESDKKDEKGDALRKLQLKDAARSQAESRQDLVNGIVE